MDTKMEELAGTRREVNYKIHRRGRYEPNLTTAFTSNMWILEALAESLTTDHQKMKRRQKAISAVQSKHEA